MVAQALAVVGEEHEHRLVPDPRCLEPRDESADDLVGVGDLAEVGLAGVARREGLGRLVRGVRIVEVDPGEEGLPLTAPSSHGRARSITSSPFFCTVPRLTTLYFERSKRSEYVEALVEAPARVEHPRPHEGARRVAGVLHPRGERRLRGLEEEAAVVADAVVRRDEAREDRRVRGQGHRRGGRRLLEEDAVAGHRVDVRRLDPAEAVAAQPVRAQGVEGDHDDVEGLAGVVGRRAGPGPRPRSAGASRGARPARPRRGRPAARAVPGLGAALGHGTHATRAFGRVNGALPIPRPTLRPATIGGSPRRSKVRRERTEILYAAPLRRDAPRQESQTARLPDRAPIVRGTRVAQTSFSRLAVVFRSGPDGSPGRQEE